MDFDNNTVNNMLFSIRNYITNKYASKAKGERRQTSPGVIFINAFIPTHYFSLFPRRAV